MKVLGITTEGDSGAAIIENGRILAAVNEERLARMKLVVGFPRLAIEEVMQLASVSEDQIDAVMIAARNCQFQDELVQFHGWLNGNASGDVPFIKRAAGRLAPYRARIPLLEDVYYALLTPSFLARRSAVREILREEFRISSPIKFIDHHFAHITSAYYTCGFDDALVISLDGGGDGKSSLVYEGKSGQLRRLHEISAYNSLGNFYAYVTILSGFKAMKHEGKITGLAAHGEPKHLPILREFVDEVEGTFINRSGVAFREAVGAIERALPYGWRREDLAASIQKHFEEVICRFVGHWARRTGQRNLALAGGVFANVRVNEELHALPEVERIFIHPHMADGGLAVGAALAACIPGVLDEPMQIEEREPLEDVYYGTELTETDINRALDASGLKSEHLDGRIEDRIAELLVEGYVVARAAGKMEYGPRALGNRSILYQPTDPSVNDWLNERLNRTEFMPFAPSVLYEHRGECFIGMEGAEHPAEFMTITFHATPWMREAMPGVVHIDGTARPHLVREDRNPSYYRIINRFWELTGLPAIINTSFNMHEEPIVCTAEDALRAFLQGDLDYLALGSHLIRHPEPRQRRMRAVKAPSVAI